MGTPGQPASEAAIHDVVVEPLNQGPGPGARLAVVSFDDHLLRRFGGAEVIRLPAGDVFPLLRDTADEVWAVLDGAADAELEDTRPDSPTRGARQHVQLEARTRLLLPFGVRLRLRAASEASFLRLMTLSEREEPPLPGE